MLNIHEVVHTNPNKDKYQCKVCPFRGTLKQAVEHVIKNQFIVPEKTSTAHGGEKIW